MKPLQKSIFLDVCYREIKIGDVLANGQRQGSHGGITIGVVHGFTTACVLVEILHIIAPFKEKYAEYSPHDKLYQKRRASNVPEGYYFCKGKFNTASNCFITGQTKEALIADIEKRLGIQVMEDPTVTWKKEHART